MAERIKIEKIVVKFIGAHYEKDYELWYDKELICRFDSTFHDINDRWELSQLIKAVLKDRRKG